MVVKLLVAILLGAALGAERTLAGQSAGMRTYSLVSVGSALFIIIALAAISAVDPVHSVDPTRILAAIATGIGFIGAGLIFVRRSSEGERRISGLTTAAGLWVAAAIGCAAGFGLYFLAVFTTLLTLFTFTILLWMERSMKKALSLEQQAKEKTH